MHQSFGYHISFLTFTCPPRSRNPNKKPHPSSSYWLLGRVLPKERSQIIIFEPLFHLKEHVKKLDLAFRCYKCVSLIILNPTLHTTQNQQNRWWAWTSKTTLNKAMVFDTYPKVQLSLGSSEGKNVQLRSGKEQK